MITAFLQSVYTVICQILVIPFRLVNELILSIDSAWNSITGLYTTPEEEETEEPQQPENSNNRHHVGFKQN